MGKKKPRGSLLQSKGLSDTAETTAPNTAWQDVRLKQQHHTRIHGPMVYLREITTNDSQIVTKCVAMTITSGVDAIVMAHTILMSLLNHLSTTFQSTVFLPIAPTQIPSDWDWSAFLQFATEFFIFAFEESDAMERWGSQNGRSLRFTGTQIYRSPVDKPGKSKGHMTAEVETTQNKGKL